MKKLLFLGLATSLMTTLALAQSHDNTKEKTVKQTIDFTADMKVGDVTLKAGSYKVQCDRETIVFKGNGTEAKFACKGEEMSAPAPRNEIHSSDGPGGVKVLTKLLLKGSSVQHVFN